MNIEEALKIADDGGQQAFVTTRGMACVALAAEVRRLRVELSKLQLDYMTLQNQSNGLYDHTVQKSCALSGETPKEGSEPSAALSKAGG